jgi:hypothetical protein
MVLSNPFKPSRKTPTLGKSFVLLASLTIQNLNQFTENLSGAEALSVEIASIYASLRQSAGEPQIPKTLGISRNTAARNPRNDAAMSHLSVFESYKHKK